MCCSVLLLTILFCCPGGWIGFGRAVSAGEVIVMRLRLREALQRGVMSTQAVVWKNCFPATKKQ